MILKAAEGLWELPERISPAPMGQGLGMDVHEAGTDQIMEPGRRNALRARPQRPG